MRRKDREVTDLSEIEEILRRARVVHLGMVDGNRPYVVPMHYGYTLTDGRLTLYLHCAREGRKLDVLRANPAVFVEIDTDESLISGGEIPCKYGASYASVMGDGCAVIVMDADEKLSALDALMRTQTGRAFPMTAQMAANVAVIRVDVDSFSAKRRPKPPTP